MKLKQKKNLKKYFLWFLFQNSKMLFLGVNQFFFNFFFQFYLLKQYTHKCYFDQYFWKRTKKPLLTAKNGQNGVFDCQLLFFCMLSKIPTKRTFVRILFLKLNQSQNTKKNFFLWGFSSKTKNALFRGSKMVFFKSQISNWYFCVCSKM